MISGDLVQFIENCGAVSNVSPFNQAQINRAQIPLWPSTRIQAGEIGILLKSQYYEELGTLCEVLIGREIFFDIPRIKIEVMS
jgi:hypothetical protein